jgi:hypothetical protein
MPSPSLVSVSRSHTLCEIPRLICTLFFRLRSRHQICCVRTADRRSDGYPHHRWPGSRTIFGCPFDHHSSCKYPAFFSLFAVLTNRIAGHALERDGFIDIVLAAHPIPRWHDGYRCLSSGHQLWSRVSLPPVRRIRNSVWDSQGLEWLSPVT